MYRNRNQYQHQHQYRSPSASPSSSPSPSLSQSRCDRKFLKSDKTIDIDEIKNFKIKYKDNTVYNNYIKYIAEKNKYNQKTGFLIRNGCKEYLDYEQEERHKEEKKRVKTIKYKTNISNCKTYKENEKKYLKEYMNSLSLAVKGKIVSKLKKTLKNPKDKRIKRLSCFIKLLLDISNSMECRGNLSISNIISKFNIEYKPAEPKIEIKKSVAKFYLEYLITNKTINDGDLKTYKELFKDDGQFVDALDKVIKSYSDCK
jgi:hypothetical protein